jgi:hypothetical protein
VSTTRISVAALAAALVLFLAACAGGPTAPVGEAPGQNAEGRTAATGATGAGGTATGAIRRSWSDGWTTG